jgi:chromosome partitioning protein
MKKTITIAITNNKGGVGKTTSCLNIGAALRRKGYKVLLIDLDAQANLTRCIKDPGAITIGAVLSEEVEPQDAIVNDLISSSKSLIKTEKDIQSEVDAFTRLKGAIEKIKGYDFILIDCPPSLGLLTTNALVAANYFLIPLQPEVFAFDGLRVILDHTDIIQKKVNPELRLLGIFATKYNKSSRGKVRQLIMEKVKGNLADYVIEKSIRENIALVESPLYHQNIYEYDDSTPGAADYLELTEELLNRMNKLVGQY